MLYRCVADFYFMVTSKLLQTAAVQLKHHMAAQHQALEEVVLPRFEHWKPRRRMIPALTKNH